MKISRFEDFEIWKLSIKITRDVYDLTAKRDFSKDYGLRDQLRRAIISTSSNIIEGFEKNNNNEFIRFLKIAKGSVGEARNQLHIALVVGYISEEEFSKTNKELENLAQQIGEFIVYLERKRKDREFTKK